MLMHILSAGSHQSLHSAVDVFLIVLHSVAAAACVSESFATAACSGSQAPVSCCCCGLLRDNLHASEMLLLWLILHCHDVAAYFT